MGIGEKVIAAAPVNSVNNRLISDVIGNKEDHIFNESLVAMNKVNVGEVISKTVRVTGTGSIVAPLLQLTGSVRILEQYAIISEVVTLVNATAIFATLYDGTNTVDLTADGIILSGAPVGTIFMKDQVAAQTYSVNVADECRMNELISDRNAGRPFTVTQKNNTDTFLRLHLTTTDSPIDFTVHVVFRFVALYNGSGLVFL